MDNLVIKNKKGELAIVPDVEIHDDILSDVRKKTWGIHGANSLHDLNLITVGALSYWGDTHKVPVIHCFADAVGFAGAYCVLWKDLADGRVRWIGKCFETFEQADEFIMQQSKEMHIYSGIYLYHEWELSKVSLPKPHIKHPVEIRLPVVISLSEESIADETGGNNTFEEVADMSHGDLLVERYLEDDYVVAHLLLNPLSLKRSAEARTGEYVDMPSRMYYTDWAHMVCSMQDELIESGAIDSDLHKAFKSGLYKSVTCAYAIDDVILMDLLTAIFSLEDDSRTLD